MSFVKTLYVFLITLLLSSCGNDKSAESKESITVATSADNPPYEYIQDSKLVGLDIDIINAIAVKIGKKIIIKNLDFPGLLPALVTNNVDAVVAGISITDERKERIDFSTGYISTAMAILYRKSEKFKSIEDFKGKILGVQMGTTWETYAKFLSSSIEDLRIRSLSNNLVLLEELKSGAVDGVIMEDMQVNKFMQNIQDLEKIILPDTKGEFAIALPKNSTLTPMINEAIKALNDSGDLIKIKDKWLLK
jgi:polar amino acid transport system substrate-binding protein